jgi:hypothetical protein
MQINCVVTTNSLQQIKGTRWRKETICKYYTLPYMPEKNACCKLEKVRGIKEVFNPSIVQISLKSV